MAHVGKTHLNRWFFFLACLLALAVLSLPAFAQLPVTKGAQGQLESPFAKVYEKVSPAVVKIDIETAVPQTQAMDPFWRQFFGIPQQQQQQRERTQPGVGSGVIVDREGRVLTNNHVIAEAKTIKIVLDTNESYDAEVVGKDPETDLAVVKMKLKGKTLPPERVAELDNSDDLKPGDYAIALGNPLGLDRTITVGVISALGRSGLHAQGGGPRYQDFIQTDAQINPGNSGGALCDINGKVIGINDMYTAQYAGIGFAIPINLAKTVMTKLIATGKVDRGYLGIGGKDVDKSVQDALDLPSAEGVIVEQVVADSPADKAGLKAGNVILTIDGQKVKNWNDFTFKIAARNPGDTARFEVLQDGSKKTVPVTLANRADYANASAEGTLSGKGETSWRGIHVVNIDNERYKQYVPDSIKNGVLVVDVDEDSPAGRSQLEDGDIITEISIEKTKMTIKTVQDFESLHQKFKNSKRTMLVYRTQVSDNGRTTKGFVTVDAE